MGVLQQLLRLFKQFHLNLLHSSYSEWHKCMQVLLSDSKFLTNVYLRILNNEDTSDEKVYILLIPSGARQRIKMTNTLLPVVIKYSVLRHTDGSVS